MISRTAGARFHNLGIVLTLEVVESSLSEAVREARRRTGAGPVGLAAASAEEALLAVEEGADEALVLVDLTTQSINELVDRMLLRARLRHEREQLSLSFAHAEKLTALGTLVAGVAHEINNPLTALTMTTEVLSASLRSLLKSAEEVHRLVDLGRPVSSRELAYARDLAQSGGPLAENAEMVEEIMEAASQMSAVVKDLRVFAKTDEEEPAALVSAESMVEHAIRLIGRELEQHAALERDYQPDLPLLVVPRMRFTQVLTNVLINASHAVREAERDVHRVRISTRADDEAVAIRVADTGQGIPEDAIDRIFDPFFTTRRERLGTGLGLSISRTILQELGGDMIVESVYGEGAEFIMLVPIPTAEQRREALDRQGRANETRASEPERLSVLVVDDDVRMLQAYGRAIGRRHNVILATDGEEAIDLIESGSAADVVLSELSLPGLDGPKLHGWLSENRPGLAPRVLFVTAAPSVEEHRSFIDRVDSRLLTKPVERSRLLAEIERLGRSGQG